MSINLQSAVRVIDESRKALARIDAKERRVLIRTGFYGRTTERRLFRRRKGASAPGQPPHHHAGKNGGLKSVIFSVSNRDKSVEIGPSLLSGGKKVRPIGKTVPQLHEEGGMARVTQEHPTRGTSVFDANYRRRPFKQRALDPTYKFMNQLLQKERL